MRTVIAIHEVDDVAHWLASPKRQEFFGPHGITARTFVDSSGSNRVGLIIETPSVELLQELLSSPEAAEAEKFDGVHADTIVIFAES